MHIDVASNGSLTLPPKSWRGEIMKHTRKFAAGSAFVKAEVKRRLTSSLSASPAKSQQWVSGAFLNISENKSIWVSVFPKHVLQLLEFLFNGFRFETIISDLKNQCFSSLPEDIFEAILQRINATSTDARMKKRAELNDKLQSLLCPTDKCSMSARVVNLSKRSLTPAEISLLSKGLKFNHSDAAPTNFLASLESVLLASAIPEDVRADIRSCASDLLRQRKRHRNLTIDEEKGLRSLKTDDSIVVVPADKGGATVIMDKADYVRKANTIFNDREAYASLAEDPTKKQAAVIKKKVNELA
nr:unnamed protein product [Spirometra erinaceieuropaei]